MRLTELEPRWTQDVLMNHHGVGQSNFAPPDFVNGVGFLCPHCRKQRLAITFTPPFGAVGWLIPGQPITDTKNIWTRDSGDTFETLTLSPSLDWSKNPDGRIDFDGHWHGYIKNGEVT